MSRYAERVRSSAVRRMMLNLYGEPVGDPSVGGASEIDATALLAFLDRVNAEAPVPITVTHVLVKLLADSLAAYPELNVKIVGRRIYRLKHVDVRLAVNLFPEGDLAPEVFLVMVTDADRKSLTTIARECAAVVDQSRSMGSSGSMTGRLLRWTRFVPDPIFNLATRAGLRLATSGRLAALGLMRDPMGSTAITNVGPFGLPDGASVVTGMGLLPRFGYASLLLAMPIQDKPVVQEGQVVARPMLPVALAIDHRAIDGYRVFRYFRYLADAVADPDAYFASRR